MGSKFDFSDISGIVSNGHDVWVQNTGRQRIVPVTELTAASGSLVRVLKAGSGFDGDDQVALDGPYLLVHNSNDTVSVLRASNDLFVRRIGLPNQGTPSANPRSWIVAADRTVWVYDGSPGRPGIRSIDTATGRVRRLVTGSAYDFNYPGPIASDGTHLWVGNGTTVTELSPSGTTLVRVLRSPAYHFSVLSIAADHNHVWVLNSSGSITEISASTAALVHVISGPQYDINGAVGIASDGSNVWVSNPCGPSCSKGIRGSGSITELSSSTGALVRVLTGASYKFKSPQALSSDGVDLWVVNAGSSTITQVDSLSGAFVRSIAANGSAINSDGTHVWLTVREGMGQKYPGPGVLELSASTGAVVADLSLSVDVPDAVVSDGTDVWIAECGCDFEYDNFGYDDYGGITELAAATGDPVAIGGPLPSDAINGPTGIAVAGGSVWVTNKWGDSVTSFPTG